AGRLLYRGRKLAPALRRLSAGAWRRVQKVWKAMKRSLKRTLKKGLRALSRLLRSLSRVRVLRLLTPAPLRRAAGVLRRRLTRRVPAPPRPPPRGLVWPLAVLKRLAGELAADLHQLDERLLLRRFERGIIRAARAVDAQVLHAHSPYRCGLAAARAGA